MISRENAVINISGKKNTSTAQCAYGKQFSAEMPA